MSKTLQSTIDWASTFLKFDPLMIAIDNGEPILSDANIVLQTILGPPFVWAWNRAFSSPGFSLTGQDVSVTIANFGFAERCSVSSSSDTFEIEQKTSMTTDYIVSQPQFFSVLTDDGSGALNIRFQPIPTGSTYTGYLVYQKAAPALTTFSSTWTPIPDRYSYIYQQGFLARSLFSANDPRAEGEGHRFIACLLGACEGLDEAQKSIFAEHWLMMQSQGAATGGKTQQGVTARSAQ